MAKHYGPWATMIDAGGNPQLNTFWRRRLTMLLPASRTDPALSRRSVVCLLAACALMIGLPTFRAHVAMADDEKPARTGKGLAPSGAPGNGSVQNERKPSEQPGGRTRGEGGKRSAAAEAAQRAYAAAVEAYYAGNGDIESIYRWSHRWMQAERPGRGPAAIQSHLDRMQMLCNRVAKLYEIGARGGEQTGLAAARYYMLEAKEMLNQAEVSKPAEPAASKPDEVAKKLATPRKDKEIEAWKNSTWQMAIALDASSLDPPAVQFAILDEDPLPAFNAEIKRMYSYQRGRYQQAENAQMKKIQRMSSMSVSWDIGFRKVNGNELYLLAGGKFRAHMMSSNGPDGKKWIVTKTLQAHGKLVCWCLPVEVEKGEMVNVTLTERNAFDLDAAYDKAMKAAGETEK